MSIFKDITGQTFGKLKVLKFSHKKCDKVFWLCICTCGKEAVVSGRNLIVGKTKSCSCLRAEKMKITSYKHGYTNNVFYGTWNRMISRCYNIRNNRYNSYGKRGIKVCDEWKRSFQNFYTWCLNSGYNEGLSLDRIDVNGDYEPKNCRWATNEEQFYNKQNSVYVTLNGTKCTLSDIIKLTGMSRSCFYRYSKRFENFQEAIDKWKEYKSTYNV